jgi:disulfide bond formation protein DsbB
VAQQRKSFDDTAKGTKAQGVSGDKSNTIKLVVAIVALIGAGVGLAYYYGVFDSPPPPTPPLQDTLDEQGRKDFEESQRINERLQQIHKTPAGS